MSFCIPYCWKTGQTYDKLNEKMIIISSINLCCMKTSYIYILFFILQVSEANSQEYVPSVDTVNSFYDAIFANNTPLVISMLENKVFPADFEPNNKVTPLQAAIWQNNPRVVEALVEKGASIDSQTKSAVLEAAEKGRFSILKFLLAQGGNINPPPHGAFNVAANNDHYDCARYLLMNGARQDLGNVEGKLKFLKAAAIQSDFEALDKLILSKEEINTPDCEGETPLIAAVKANLLDVVAYLSDRGADKKLRETFDCGDDISYGMTPIEIALELGFSDIVNYLSDKAPA